jgi:Peptidase family C25
MCYPASDSRQVPHQGALLCQDWPGPECEEEVSRDHFFSGEDVGSDASVFGMIAMHFACFGAGTPMLSDYTHSGEAEAIAGRGFLGQLPQRLLAHPRGGALAVIGHVERAWGCSFHWDGAGSQTEVFKSTMKRLMEGHPVGSALEYFNGRYAELSSDLSNCLEEARFGATIDPYHLSGLWTANNDARSYSVIGDPAVRLMLAEVAVPVERPMLEVRAAAQADPATTTELREIATSLRNSAQTLEGLSAASLENDSTQAQRIELLKTCASTVASLTDGWKGVGR